MKFAIWLGIGFVAMFLFFVGASGPRVTLIEDQAHSAVASKLLSPENAQFDNEHISANGRVVCGWVSGVNAFGVRLAPVKYHYEKWPNGQEDIDLATDEWEYRKVVRMCAASGL